MSICFFPEDGISTSPCGISRFPTSYVDPSLRGSSISDSSGVRIWLFAEGSFGSLTFFFSLLLGPLSFSGWGGCSELRAPSLARNQLLQPVSLARDRDVLLC